MFSTWRGVVYRFDCKRGMSGRASPELCKLAGGGIFGRLLWSIGKLVDWFDATTRLLTMKGVDLHLLVQIWAVRRHIRRSGAAPVANCHLAPQLSEMVKFSY